MSECPYCHNTSTRPLRLLKTLRHTYVPHTSQGLPLCYCKNCGAIYVGIGMPNLELQKLLTNNNGGDSNGPNWD